MQAGLPVRPAVLVPSMRHRGKTRVFGLD